MHCAKPVQILEGKKEGLVLRITTYSTMSPYRCSKAYSIRTAAIKTIDTPYRPLYNEISAGDPAKLGSI